MKSILTPIKRFVYHPDVYLAGLLERRILKRDAAITAPPLFILGLPRSGTTLVYQYIVNRLQVAYLTNGVGRYYLSPYLTTLWQNRLYGSYQSDFHSTYGKVSGPVAPREAGAFWSRFLGIDDYVGYDDLVPGDAELLRTILASVQLIYGGAPFVNKNVKHLLRIDALSKIFPTAFFLVVKRDMKDVALSVLRGRYANQRDPREWWSVRPPDFEDLKALPPHVQVARQLVSLNHKLNLDLSPLSGDRVLYADYAEFCDRPEHLIHLLKDRYETLSYRNAAVCSFERSILTAKTNEEHSLLEELANLSVSKEP